MKGPVLFRVAAGPRLGFGHLRRAETLADALGATTRVSIRGQGGPTRLSRVAASGAARTLDAVRPSVLVIDDPRAAAAAPWVAAAAARAIPSVSVHDLGLGRVPSDLAIDGSVVSPARGWPASRVRRGLPYAVIGRPGRRTRFRGGDVRRVLVSLGGGRRRVLTRDVVQGLLRAFPALQVWVTQDVGVSRAQVIDTHGGLAAWLARMDAAIIGGGVSLYEAIGAGVASLAVPVVDAQRPTIEGFAARGLVRTAPLRGPGRRDASRIVSTFGGLMADEAFRRHLHAAGPKAVDGRGARRAAAEIAVLIEARAHG